MDNRFCSQASVEMTPFAEAGLFASVPHLVNLLMRQSDENPAERNSTQLRPI